MNEKKLSSLLPPDLPLTAGQEQWLAGFLAGLKQSYATLRESFGTAGSGLKPLHILYGSQTGNAESLAYLCADLAKAHGMAGEVKEMSAVSAGDVKSMERLIVITSTYGEGEMPDNAQSLWDEMEGDTAPTLQGVFFAVLAIGDSGYDDFCEAGKKWDARLAELGAKRIAERIDCDVDFEAPAQTWLENVLPLITTKGSQESTGNASSPAAPSPARPASQYTRNNPLIATLKRKKLLSGAGSGKQIFHYEIDLGDSGEHYDAGDIVHLFPLNRQELVEELLTTIDATGEEVVSWQGENLPLRALLTTKAEIRTPSRDFWAAFLSAAQDGELLQWFENPDRSQWDNFVYGKDIVDLLRAFPAAKFTAQTLADTLKPLAARAYSISSSIRQNPAAVHVTVGAVRYEQDGRKHYGVASTWLADLVEEGDKIACYFAANKHFSIPEDGATPIIMVGPGTGIAPFRAFLQERDALGATGENWLFFGDRTRKDDFIYEEELTAMQNSGLLTRLDLAFSREQREKIYVQDKMREHGAELFAWLERGAYFYVCGDASKMAKDVDSALQEIIATYGKIDSAGAAEYVNALKKAKRYVRDVY